MSNELVEQLILDNIPLIYKCIKDLHLYYKTEDEFQAYYDAGLDGLMKGARKYDGSKDIKPSSFLYPCIKNEILHLLTIKNLKKNKNEHGRNISLNITINDDSNKLTEFGDLIPDLETNIELEIEKKLEAERLLAAVNQLKNEKDKLVVKMYYGLDGYEPGTYESVSKYLGVTKQAIQARLKRAKNNLKQYLEKNDREVFIIKNKEKRTNKKEVISMSQNNSSEKKNTLSNLNDILFTQLEKLEDPNNDDVTFEKEIRKSYAVAQLAQQIVSNNNTCIKALKLAKEHKIDNDDQLKFIGLK